MCQNLDPELEALATFDRRTVQVRFLFGEDVERYKTHLRKRAISLRRWNEIYDQGTQDPDGDSRFKEAVEGRAEESQWFAEQFNGRVYRTRLLGHKFGLRGLA